MRSFAPNTRSVRRPQAACTGSMPRLARPWLPWTRWFGRSTPATTPLPTWLTTFACRLDAPAEWAPLQVRAQIRHQILLAFKEALQNVLKHAAATEVALTLRFEAPEMVVFLEDNGRGIPRDPAGTEKDGLSNMRERLQSVGGICRVSPRTEGGTCVEMRVKI